MHCAEMFEGGCEIWNAAWVPTGWWTHQQYCKWTVCNIGSPVNPEHGASSESDDSAHYSVGAPLVEVRPNCVTGMLQLCSTAEFSILF